MSRRPGRTSRPALSPAPAPCADPAPVPPDRSRSRAPGARRRSPDRHAWSLSSACSHWHDPGEYPPARRPSHQGYASRSACIAVLMMIRTSSGRILNPCSAICSNNESGKVQPVWQVMVSLPGCLVITEGYIVACLATNLQIESYTISPLSAGIFLRGQVTLTIVTVL